MNFWMAIDKATVANGCLFVAPGSHSQTLPHDPHPVQGRVMQADAAASLAALVPVELEPGDGASAGLWWPMFFWPMSFLWRLILLWDFFRCLLRLGARAHVPAQPKRREPASVCLHLRRRGDALRGAGGCDADRHRRRGGAVVPFRGHSVPIQAVNNPSCDAVTENALRWALLGRPSPRSFLAGLAGTVPTDSAARPSSRQLLLPSNVGFSPCASIP